MKFPIVASIGVVTAALATAGLAGDGELPRGLAQVIVDSDRADDASTAVQLSQAHGPAAPESTQDPPPLRVDESALRYFASKGDTARLEAEIARLRALYQNWTRRKIRWRCRRTAMLNWRRCGGSIPRGAMRKCEGP